VLRLLAVEPAAASAEVVERLDPAAREGYWDRNVAGHVDDGTGRHVPPTTAG
jgi:hypothetical protein